MRHRDPLAVNARPKGEYLFTFSRHFCEHLTKIVLQTWTLKDFYRTKNCLFVPQTGKNNSPEITLWAVHILAVRIEKFRPLREPIRVLFIADQFSHVLKIVITLHLLGVWNLNETRLKLAWYVRENLSDFFSLPPQISRSNYGRRFLIIGFSQPHYSYIGLS